MSRRIDSEAPPEANPPVRRPRRDAPGPGMFALDSLRMAWRWLTRMRTALYLLGVLGLLTLLATLVPQEPNVARTAAAWRRGTEGPGVVVSGLIDLVGGYDVYGSPIFLATLLLLFISLTACLLPRYRAWWRLARSSRPPRVSRIDRQPEVMRFTTAVPPDQALDEARALLGRKRYRLRAADADPDRPPQVAGERGHISRELGSLIFHTSFYVLLIGVVAGQLLGFTGQVGVVEGHRWADAAVSYWSYQPGRLWGDDDHRGFVLDLDEFHVDWHRDPRFGGQPKLFSSDVTVTRADGSVLQEPVAGNDPLVVDGMKIHQLDWGYAPRVVVEVEGEVVHDAYLTLQQGVPGAEGAAQVGAWYGVVKAPAAEPDVGIELFLWPYAPVDGSGEVVFTGAPWADAPLVLVNEWRGDLQLDRSQNVNFLDKRGLIETGAGALRPGTEIELADGVVVAFPELRRWVGFQVSHRPTVPLLLVGAVLVLVGLVPALYAYRRRVWVEAAVEAVPDDDGGLAERTLVTVAGRAFQRPERFTGEHVALASALRDRLEGHDVEPAEARPAPDAHLGPTATAGSATRR